MIDVKLSRVIIKGILLHTMSKSSIIPEKQKRGALVLQGGGALGAYEVGVLSVLCDKLEGKERYKKDEPLFDIITGANP